MKKYDSFDLAYVTIDSLSEGVGSSQITPLISRLSKSGLKINLISYEKSNPNSELVAYFKSVGVEWNFRNFGSNGLMGGVARLNNLRQEIPKTNLIHARSDIPAVSAIASRQAPVLWDVRSLWADQKVMIQENLVNKTLYGIYRGLESIAASRSIGMSTLTSAVVPILEQRHKRLPLLRTVVPTAVDLDYFKLNPMMPPKAQALFSGTYNEYYDLNLSRLFMEEFRKLFVVDTHWARPAESNKSHIGVGESKVFPSTQTGMANLIPDYSFGVSVCKMDAGPSLSAAMPTKIGEFLACGRPIVVNRGLGDMDQFLKEFNAGVILDGTPTNLVESATRLASLLSDSETPVRCRALAEKYFSMDVGANKYLNLYSRILNMKG
ncbi:MAG: glycosyltransferase [Candidatus Planktophila sp.]|nr:glycosyltransferase [Candidatus Planktophila sp.]